VKERLRGPAKGVLALTADQERAIAACYYNEEGEFEPRMRCFDAENGQLISVCPFPLTGGWTVVAAAPDFEDVDEFWTLHSNGYLINWAENFMIVGFDAPIPGNVVPGLTSRSYWDLDIGEDGTVYITALDRAAGQMDATYLYRKAPGALWGRETVTDANGFPLMNKECRVDHDDLSGTTLVLDSDTCTVFRFDGLESVGSVDLPPSCGIGLHGYTDLAACGNYVTVSTYSLGPNGGMLFQVNALTGEVTDELPFGRPEALADKAPLIGGQPGEISVFVSGLDYFPGKYGLVEITLEASN
jgi:hypothetical protein